tara:strand:+ start:649 stop:1185 length:537 start_codon:yes stop_codon:yes gene_type:complete
MKKTLMCAVAVGLGLSAFGASAETIKQTTIERQMIDPGVKVIDVTDFDLNNSGTISIDEVGEKLFYLYDIDGNEIIDNQEFDQPLIASVVPVERETITVVDINSDGVSEETSYEVDRFMKQTRLAMFDTDKDGLSPHEFIGEGFLKLDSNDDMSIDINEWKSAYTVDFKAHDDSETFN